MGICEWTGGCYQPKTDISGEYCYYHFKLVEGQLAADPPPKERKALSEELHRSGAARDVVESSKVPRQRDPVYPESRKMGRVPSGRLIRPTSKSTAE